MPTKPEILSPVGSKQSVEAAVRSGADAVYIGAKRFSARRKADNFDFDDIKETVKYCHTRGVKVYLTLNIMIKQAELADAFNTALSAYKCGIDAVIISDLGLAELIHKNIPNLPLHASTQMTVHSPSAIKVLKELGFKRIVVSREMSKAELEAFCASAEEQGIEVEVFVHGALCMSVSGQCLLSSILGARSGNRGLCAGPCRLPFKVSGGTGFDLSLKDLSLYSHIDELIKMGVSSFKIEGRMKRPEYVAAATAACRQAIDNGFIDDELYKTLQSVFSRSGFTDGYYTSTLGCNMFGIRTKDDVTAAGDTYSYLHNLYRIERQSVPIEITAHILSGKPTVITVTDGVDSVTATGAVPEAAKNTMLEENQVHASLTKLGNTPYYCSGISIKLDKGLFVSASQLNSLRRNAVEMLNKARAELEPVNYTSPQLSSGYGLNGKKQMIARFCDTAQIPDDLENIKAVILPLNCEMPRLDNVEVIAELPRYMADEAVVYKRLKALRQSGIATALCGSISAVAVAKAAGLNAIGSFGLNIENSESIKAVKKIGAFGQLLSSEISIDELKNINSEIPIGIFAYGRLPLMLTRNCPLKNGRTCADCNRRGVITDRRGIEFPIRCSAGYSEVLNSTPLYMGDKLNEIPDVDFLLLYFSTESKSEAARIIQMYNNRESADFGFTRNLYYRDLI